MHMCIVYFCTHTFLSVTICGYRVGLCVLGLYCVCPYISMCTRTSSGLHSQSSVQGRRVGRPLTVHFWPGLDMTCSDCNPGRHPTGDGEEAVPRFWDKQSDPQSGS